MRTPIVCFSIVPCVWGQKSVTVVHMDVFIVAIFKTMCEQSIAMCNDLSHCVLRSLCKLNHSSSYLVLCDCGTICAKFISLPSSLEDGLWKQAHTVEHTWGSMLSPLAMMGTLVGNIRLISSSNNLFQLLIPVVLFLPRTKKKNLNTEP